MAQLGKSVKGKSKEKSKKEKQKSDLSSEGGESSPHSPTSLMRHFSFGKKKEPKGNAVPLEQTLTTVLAEEASVSRWGSGATSKKGSAVMVGGTPTLMLIFMEAARPKSSIAGRSREVELIAWLR